MKQSDGIRFVRAAAAVLLTAAFTLCIPPGSSAQSSIPKKGEVSLNFEQIDINTFIRYISEITGISFLVDQKVRGRVTIISPEKVTPDEAYEVFKSVLEVHGFTTVKAGEVRKIVQSRSSATKALKTRLIKETGEAEDQVITQVLPLKYARAADIRRLFRPLLSRNSLILSYRPTNMLIITDVKSNLNRLIRILNAIDIRGVKNKVSTVRLDHADAGKTSKVLLKLFRNRRVRRTKGARRVVSNKFIADERTNTIVIVASADDTARIRELIELLDVELPRGKGKIHVYYLEHADAESLSKILEKLKTSVSKTRRVRGGRKTAPILGEQVRVKPHKATNSLIIMADKHDYITLERVIRQLDIPRKMVYIECLIMEVNPGVELLVGAEWMAAGKASHQDIDGGYGGGFSGGGDQPYGNLGDAISLDGAGGTLPPGFSLGVFGESIEINDVAYPSIGAVVMNYKHNKHVNILSTPQIMVTDNEESRVSVGKNVPYITKSGSSTVESYNTFEYKDVGIDLKVTPHIGTDDSVRLEIAQEVAKLDERLSTGNNRPTTLKRTVETTVIVEDENTVVVGGLIDDSLSEVRKGLPCLGSIPVLGALFSAMNRNVDKTNLYVFLTPHVIDDPLEAREISEQISNQHIQPPRGG